MCRSRYAFHILDDYQVRLLEVHRKLEAAYGDVQVERVNLESRPMWAKRLFEFGDYTEAEYLTRRDDLILQLQSLKPVPKQTSQPNKLAQFLTNVLAAWAPATQRQRNKLARALFDQVWLRDKTVIVLKPRTDLEPFFRLNYEYFGQNDIEDDTSTRVHSYPSQYPSP